MVQDLIHSKKHRNNSLSEKLVGITSDWKLKFNKHIKDICLKASQKLNSLERLELYMGTTKITVYFYLFISIPKVK